MNLQALTIKTLSLFLCLFACYGCQPEATTSHPLEEYNLIYQKDIGPKNSSEISRAPWGVHFNGTPFHDMTFAQYDSLDVVGLLAELPKLIQASKDLGLKWARISIDWGLVEDNQGNFHWEIMDPMIKGLIAAGIEVYPSLHAGHKIHTNNQPPRSAQELEAWLHFIQQFVDRYQSEITYWEIWNEPNTTWFWGGAPKASEYFNLVKVSAKLIRSIDPDSKVIGGSLARLDVPYADTLFQLGIADHIDVFSFHPYGVFPEAALKKMDAQVRMPLLYEPIMNPVQGLIDLVEASGKDIELWQGECGYPSAMNGGGWNGTGPFGEKIQAKWILRRAFTDLSFGAKVSAYFMLKENKHPHWDFYNYKGLLRYDDLSEKRAYQVFQNLCATVNGDLERDTQTTCTFEILEAGELAGIRPKNLRSLVLKNGDATLIAYWGMTHLQNDVETGKIKLKISRLDQVDSFQLIDLYEGHTYQIKEITPADNTIILNDLPLGDYPFLIKIQ